jgi:polyisoprenoid-binding protein YceI
MGHNLVIVMDDWSATVTMSRGRPRAVSLSVVAASLRIESGSGGIKPITDRDRADIRSNALGALHADEHPEVTFEADDLRLTGDTLAVEGTLTVAGTARAISALADVERADGRVRVHCTVPVRQSDFGVTPYSTMLGQLRVADEVRINLDVEVAEP